MDETDVGEFMDVSEVRSVSLGEKRPLEDGVESDLANKKARGGGEEVRLEVNVKKVAEIVLVLATMGKMRGGRKPTSVEVKLMAEAREKLAEICEGFAPKDVFPKEAFGTIIEELGLNRLKETKLGNRPPKMSIAERLQFTKQKMEKSEVFPLHSATYTRGVSESAATSHVVPTSKADNAPIPSRSFQNHSTVAHASPVSNSRTLPYQLPTSQVRPAGVSSVIPTSHLGRNSTASSIGRPQLSSDEKSNAKSAGDHKTSNTPTRSTQSQPTSFTQISNINHHMQHRMNFGQPPPSINTHNEICKIVQKVLQPLIPKPPTWTPPSRDYMNKPLTCQTCKLMINEVDTTLLCDACERGYHLKCLQSNPRAILGDEWLEWHCTKCLAISNGKALPPKYGRVLRNITNPIQLQSSSEKKDENFNQRLMKENGSFGSQTVSSESVKDTNGSIDNMKTSGTRDSGTEKSCIENGIKVECNTKGEIVENEEGVETVNSVKTNESRDPVEENDGSSSSSKVDWVGSVVNEDDGKTYYASCCISGIVYKLQDYALFSSSGNKLMPNKLQSMWEDKKTNKKWVTVTRCFFPDDLPEGVGRPCSPETNEVYESNHETRLAAVLIHGPCEVVPPRKFSEEMQVRSQTTTTDKLKPLFLCKWFYDETKRLFRDVTC